MSSIAAMRTVWVACFIWGSSAAGTPWYPYSRSNWERQVTNHHYICGFGAEQSPINFPSCSNPVSRPVPKITWATQEIKFINNGHTIQMTITQSNPGKMEFDLTGTKKTYTLVQCHIHIGAEHQVGGRQPDGEIHCVHTLDGSNLNQRYGVFGLFFKSAVTSTNGFFAQFGDVPAKPTRRLSETQIPLNVYGEVIDVQRRLAGMTTSTYKGPVDFQMLSANVAMDKYWSYSGSFTTPPCTEAVDFYIFQQELNLKTSIFDELRTKIGWSAGNFRPPQAIASRDVFGCSMLPAATPDEHWYPYAPEVWSSKVGINSAAVCAGGSEQSPIDFAACSVPQEMPAVELSWQTQPVELINNGHTVQLTAMGGNPGNMAVNGKEYKLLQCHFHYNSEHTVAGKSYPFEAHCVHQDTSTLTTEAKHYGVFGILFEIGTSDNDFLSLFEGHLTSPMRRLSSDVDVDVSFTTFGYPMDRMTKRRLASTATKSSYTGPLDYNKLHAGISRTKYWSYPGSFTTPPCTEAVDFYIMQDMAMLSDAQLSRFKSKITWVSAGGNFRPPQPIGSRIVAGCARLVDTKEIIAAAVDPISGQVTAMLVLSVIILVSSIVTMGLLFIMMLRKTAPAAKAQEAQADVYGVSA